jgi:TetR/AcrR family transcriptional regulator, cholesterol catabolism regulator
MAVAKRQGRATSTTAETINQVAVSLFYRQGFQATPLRQIAGKVGVQVGSLYNHIQSKEELLFGIMRDIMAELLARLPRRRT